MQRRRLKTGRSPFGRHLWCNSIREPPPRGRVQQHELVCFKFRISLTMSFRTAAPNHCFRFGWPRRKLETLLHATHIHSGASVHPCYSLYGSAEVIFCVFYAVAVAINGFPMPDTLSTAPVGVVSNLRFESNSMSM